MTCVDMLSGHCWKSLQPPSIAGPWVSSLLESLLDVLSVPILLHLQGLDCSMQGGWLSSCVHMLLPQPPCPALGGHNWASGLPCGLASLHPHLHASPLWPRHFLFLCPQPSADKAQVSSYTPWVCGPSPGSVDSPLGLWTLPCLVPEDVAACVQGAASECCLTWTPSSTSPPTRHLGSRPSRPRSSTVNALVSQEVVIHQY